VFLKLRVATPQRSFLLLYILSKFEKLYIGKGVSKFEKLYIGKGVAALKSLRTTVVENTF